MTMTSAKDARLDSSQCVKSVKSFKLKVRNATPEMAIQYKACVLHHVRGALQSSTHYATTSTITGKPPQPHGNAIAHTVWHRQYLTVELLARSRTLTALLP